MGKVEMIVDSNFLRTLLEYADLKLSEKANIVVREAYNEVSKAYLKATPIK